MALTRDHETWPCGESRRRDWLRRVPSPIEGRLLFQVTTHCLSCFLGLRGMARARPLAAPAGFALRAPATRRLRRGRIAASTACFRRPPSHENRLRGSRKRLRCAKAARKQRKTLSRLAVGIPMLHHLRDMPHRTYAGGYFTPQPCRQRPTIPVRVFSCAAEAAFVSRASDADRRSRRRGDAGRRSPKQSNLREAQGTAPRPSSHGVAAPSQAALAARQMRRVSWSRASAKHANIGYVETIASA